MSSLLLLQSMLIANVLKTGKDKKKKKKLKVPKVKKKVSKQKKLSCEMCRICYKEKGDIPIFNNYDQPNLVDEIRNFSGVTIDDTEEMPNQMCKECLNLLNGCIKFREMCLNTQKIIIESVVKKELTKEPPLEPEFKSEDINGDDYHEEEYITSSPIDYAQEFNLNCLHCDKNFDDMETYNKHKCKGSKAQNTQNTKDPVDKTKVFLCDICGKTTSSNANLLTHMTTHENVFPYKCELCPYKGRTVDLLRVHKRSHMTEKPYKCTLCPRATTSASNLQKHMRHVHFKSRTYKCTYCEKAFLFQHDMKRHITDIHLRQSMVECNICFKKFNTRKILRGHKSKVHKIKGERQGRLPSYLQCKINDTTNTTLTPANTEIQGNNQGQYLT